MRFAVPLLLSLIAAWPQAAEVAPEPANELPLVAPAVLARLLPVSPLIADEGGRLRWRIAGGPSFIISQVDSATQNPLIETAIGVVAVSRILIEEHREDALRALAPLIARAQTEATPPAGMTFSEGVLVGLHLRSAGVLVLADAVLHRSQDGAKDRSGDRARLQQAVAATADRLEHVALDPLAKRAVSDLVRRLARDDPDRSPGELHPSLARRLLRTGALDGIPGLDFADLRRAVQDACELRPVTIYKGGPADPDAVVQEVRDAFGAGGWMMRTATTSRLIRPYPDPAFNFSSAPMQLVVELPPASDPMAGIPPGGPLGARLVDVAGRPLSAWSKTQGFASEETAWRRSVPVRGKGIDPDTVANFIPPHVTVMDLRGDLDRICTAFGTVQMPRAGDQSGSANRFLGEAAQALPDAAHLDLLGETAFAYAADGPDPRLPGLPGAVGARGDRHQTPEDIINRAAGGWLTGDSDDLAEFYQRLAERQGRSPFTIDLPEGNAAAWAEPAGDQRWRIVVLQNGPALAIEDRDLPAALARIYRRVDPASAVDPDALPIVLRFPGERSRTTWWLGARVFSDPAWARAMIDLRRDKHYNTCQRGLVAMEKLIASSEREDQDAVNHRELAQLAEATGQYRLAIEQHRRALELSGGDSLSRLLLDLHLVTLLADAGREAQARAAALDLIDRQIPAAAARLGPASVQVTMDAAEAFLAARLTDLAERALRELPLTALEPRLAEAVQISASSEPAKEAAWRSPAWLIERRTLRRFATLGADVLAAAGPAANGQAAEPRRRLTTAVQTWIDKVAFRDLPEPGDELQRYRVAARFYEALLGAERLAPMLDAVAPANATTDHTARNGGVAQLASDLPWIRMSTPYWAGCLQAMVARNRATLDRKQVERLAQRLEEAEAARAKVGIVHTTLDAQAHGGRVLAALLLQDEPAFRALVQSAVRRGDQAGIRDTARCIGESARFLDQPWFRRVLAVLSTTPEQEAAFRTEWFLIAWRAAVTGAKAHARIAAADAAKRFGEQDPAFAEEAAYLEQIVGVSK